MTTSIALPHPQAAPAVTPPLRRLRHLVEAVALRLLARALVVLPRRLAVALGEALGWAVYYLLAQDRRVALANLDIAFGDTKPKREKRRLAREAFQTFGRNLAGLFWSPRLNEGNIRRHVELDPANWQWLQQVRSRGNGVILISAHWGDWELGLLATGFLGSPCTTVTEPTTNPAIERLITGLRSASGHACVHPRFAMLKLFKALRRGGAIALMVDVNARRGRGGAWLDFFGVPVFNTPAVAQLARRTGAAIVFVTARPLPGGRVKLSFGPQVEPAAAGDDPDDVLTTSQRCLDNCAALVRGNPEHWLWTYKRWKRRPTPAAGPYPFYSKYDANTDRAPDEPAPNGGETAAPEPLELPTPRPARVAA